MRERTRRAIGVLAVAAALAVAPALARASRGVDGVPAPVAGPPALSGPAAAAAEPAASPPASYLQAPLELAQRALRPRAARDTSAIPAEPGAARPKSPGLAVALAAVVPGSGQLYMGQRHGYVQLGTEALAWLSYLSLHKSGSDKQDEYHSYVGDPTAASLDARWLFERYCPTSADCDTTDYNDLRRQWQDDPTRFYESITDPRYAQGWTTTAAADSFRTMRDQANRFLRFARYATAIVLVNHVVSLIDAIHSTKNLRVSRAVPALTVDWAFDPVGRRGPRGHASLVYHFR